MPKYVVLLPEDMFGVFSTIVDAFVFVGNREETANFLKEDFKSRINPERVEIDVEAIIQLGIDDKDFTSPDDDPNAHFSFRRLRGALYDMALNRDREQFEEEVNILPLTKDLKDFAMDIFTKLKEVNDEYGSNT